MGMNLELSYVRRALEATGAVVDPVIEKHLAHGADPTLTEILTYQIKTVGTKLAPMLVMCSAEVAGDRASSIPAAAVFELAHNILTIVDDIVERRKFRGGFPTTWKKFGQTAAIFIAQRYREAIFGILNRCDSPDRLENLVSNVLDSTLEEEMLGVLLERSEGVVSPFVSHRGQGTATDARQRVIKTRTTTLFEGCCRAGAIAGSAPKQVEEALVSYGFNLGCLFQVRDDALDILRAGNRLGKDTSRKLRRKVRNIVILLGPGRLSKDNRRILRRLVEEPATREEIMDAVNLLRSAGFNEECISLAARYKQATEEALSTLPNSEARSTLEALSNIPLRSEHQRRFFARTPLVLY